MTGKEQLMKSSMAAGLLIALAASVFLGCDNKYIGAFLFSLGLLSIMNFQLKLFTGCTGYLADAQFLNRDYRKDAPWIGAFQVISYKERSRDLLLILIGNFAGAAIFSTLIGFTVPELKQKAILIMQHKEEAAWYTMLFRAFCCGMLMQLAFYTKTKIGNVPITYLMAIMCIMSFILAGFEHCIADIAYAFFAWSWTWKTTLLLVLSVIGNFFGGDHLFRQLDWRI